MTRQIGKLTQCTVHVATYHGFLACLDIEQTWATSSWRALCGLLPSAPSLGLHSDPAFTASHLDYSVAQQPVCWFPFSRSWRDPGFCLLKTPGDSSATRVRNNPLTVLSPSHSASLLPYTQYPHGTPTHTPFTSQDGHPAVPTSSALPPRPLTLLLLARRSQPRFPFYTVQLSRALHYYNAAISFLEMTVGFLRVSFQTSL